MPPASPPRATAPQGFERRRLRNRAALIEAALALFQERGVRGVKLEEICERADVAPRTFFNHFETREHLYEAIALQRASQLAAAFDAACQDPAPLAGRLRAYFAATGSYLEERPLYRELVGVMLSRGVDGSSEITRTRTIGRAARRLVENGVERGEITRRHAPEVLADLLIGALNTALTNWSASEAFPLAESLDQAALALADLLAPSSEEQASKS